MQRDHNGPVVACQMYDIVYKLASSVAGDNFMFAAKNKITFKKTWTESSYL